MAFALINDNLFDYIAKNLNCDTNKLLLRDSRKDCGFSVEFAVTQIESRRKCKTKLSRYLANQRFLFPTLLSAEQASHQIIADYHAGLIGKNKRVLDITAGLGIDSLSIASKGNRLTSIEIDSLKSEIFRHNAKTLGLGEIEVINQDSISFLRENPDLYYDIIFADPARRAEYNKRLYSLDDCSPDIIKNLELIRSYTKRLLIKASPMIDITESIRLLPETDEIHLVHIDGECKEVLICCDLNDNNGDSAEYNVKDRKIKVINFKEGSFTEEFNSESGIQKWNCLESELGNTQIFAEIDELKSGCFVYEPLAGIHKLNHSAKLCMDFPGMKKLSPNTSLYLSAKYYENFPGRIFKIEAFPDKSSLKRLKGCRMEVSTRNYVMSAEEIRKKYSLASGGNGRYLMGMRTGIKETPVLLICERVLD